MNPSGSTFVKKHATLCCAAVWMRPPFLRGKDPAAF
jgi:hypothetical protein